MHKAWPFLLVCLLSAASVQATVTNVAYWRMGESDPGAKGAGAATNAIDSAATNTLQFLGSATYSTDVSPFAAAWTGSSLSVNFTNSAYAISYIVSAAQDNFGIECWVKPTTSGINETVVYNGITGGANDGGWGFVISGNNTYQALYGGVLAFGTNAATPNVWTHLALVRAGGVSTLYVNGIATVTNTAAPGLPLGHFAVATTPQTPTAGLFTGLVDELRVFTFAPGQFSPSDLLFQHQTVVTNLADSGLGSLREILTNAVDGDVITFATNGVITLAGSELLVTKSINITGPGALNLAISGNSLSRVFNVPTNVSLTVSGLTICNGCGVPGGGISNAGNLSLNNCMLSNNAAELSFSGFILSTGVGGGIYNVGSVLLNSCTLWNNRAGDAPAATTGNGSAGNDGGAIYNLGNAILVQCTVCNNSAGRGGDGGFGFPSPGSGGNGGNGGAIVNSGSGSLQLIACTVARNNGGVNGSGGAGGGSPGSIGAVGGILQAGAGATMINTLVALNPGSSAPDVSGAFISFGHNLIRIPTGGTGFTNTDLLAVEAGLATLDYWGGKDVAGTLTAALLPGNPAIDTGDDALLGGLTHLTVDERGFPRKAGAHIDIGAYESNINFSNAVVTTISVAPFEDPTFGFWLATLQGAVNPGGYPSTVYFDYGTTPGYGQQTAAGTLAFLNMSNNPVSATISNLVISQTYHYRVVASNSAGVFTGADRTFTVLPPIIVDTNGDGFVDANELNAVLSHLGSNRVSASNVNQILQNYLAGDTSLLMSNVAGLGNSNVTFNLLNSPALNFTVQSSTNLTDWLTLGPAQLIYRFTDTNAPLAPNRMYRLVYP